MASVLPYQFGASSHPLKVHANLLSENNIIHILTIQPNSSRAQLLGNSATTTVFEDGSE